MFRQYTCINSKVKIKDGKSFYALLNWFSFAYLSLSSDI